MRSVAAGACLTLNLLRGAHDGRARHGDVGEWEPVEHPHLHPRVNKNKIAGRIMPYEWMVQSTALYTKSPNYCPRRTMPYRSRVDIHVAKTRIG